MKIRMSTETFLYCEHFIFSATYRKINNKTVIHKSLAKFKNFYKIGWILTTATNNYLFFMVMQFSEYLLKLLFAAQS